MMLVTNGKLKALLWLTGLVATILLGLGSWNLCATVDHTSRIATVETKIEDTEAAAEKSDERLNRIENKIDRLIGWLINEKANPD